MAMLSNQRVIYISLTWIKATHLRSAARSPQTWIKAIKGDHSPIVSPRKTMISSGRSEVVMKFTQINWL